MGEFKPKKNKGLTLKCLRVSGDLFDSLLVRASHRIETVDSCEPFFKGYKGYNFKYDPVKQVVVCLEFYIDKTADTFWKQVVVRRDDSLATGTLLRDIDGSRAWSLVTRELKKYYTDTEVDTCLNSFQAEYNPKLKQYHYDVSETDIKGDYVLKYDNCVKYDINGAHCDALREIFPKAAEYFEKMYNERKSNPIYKAVVNYFVGMLKRKGYEKTYNWIVQRTTSNLFNAIREVGGRLVYANTDGFIAHKPVNELSNCEANVLGKFKEEFRGPVYLYRSDNYTVIETNKLTGNVLCAVRKDFNLRDGQVLSYKRQRMLLDSGAIVQVPVDIEIKHVEVRKYGKETCRYKNL